MEPGGQYYRTLIEGALDVTTTIDASGRILFESPSVFGVLGLRPEDRIGTNIFDNIHPDDAGPVARLLEEHVRAGKPVAKVELRVRDAQGEWRTIESYARNLLADPNVRAIVVNSRDITSRREAEDELRTSRERLRIAQRAGGIATWEYDFEPRGSADVEWLESVHGEDRERVAARFAQCASERCAYEDEFRVVRPDGAVQWVASKSEVVTDGTGAPERLVGVNIDITDLKRVERELAVSRDEAVQASQMKSRFLATVSHEIRTPMNAIMGLAGLLIDTPLVPEQRADMEVIRSSAIHLLDLINGILDLSKAEAGKIHCDRVPFDLRPALVSVLELVEPAAAGKGLHLALEYPAELRSTVLGDAGRVRQIVLNFVANAVKFTPHGSVTIHVTAGGEDVLRIAVADTGEGIPEEVQGRMFEPFVQGDSNGNGKQCGTGLGLAISKWLAEAMGGRVDACSRPEGGSEFWVELPLPAASAGSCSTDETRLTAPFTKRGHRVLVVEDNGVNQKVLVRLLEKRGVRADVAANGIEAVHMWRDFPYDLVFMDCRMPEMDGYEATRHIRALEHGARRVPIVAVTAHVGGLERQRCFACGMDGYLQKPFHPSELDEMLLRFLSPESTLTLLNEAVDERYDYHPTSATR